MEKLVKSKIGDAKPSEVKKILLDGNQATKIAGITEEFTSLEWLSMNDLGLKSLDGLPKLPSLKKLEVCDNKFTGGWNIIVERCPNLEKLALSGCEKIDSLECLEPFKKLEKLRALELLACPISKIKDYRDSVFKCLPQIKYLDTFSQKEEEEAVSSGDEEEDDEDEESDAEEDEEDDEDDSDEDAHPGPTLKALYDEELGDDSDEFEEVDEDEDDDEDDDEEEEAADERPAKKRKMEDEENGDKA